MSRKKVKLSSHIKLQKAYNKTEFMSSSDARSLRVLSEFLEPKTRFRKNAVKHTIVFFGSARTLPPDKAKNNLAEIEKIKSSKSNHDRDILDQYEQAKRDLITSKYYEAAEELAKKITEWSLTIKNKNKRFYVCSGGGPGIMEAANRGASIANGPSIGLNISLPYEQYCNPYITPNLAFEFHYFFIRKFWFFYLSKAMIVFPGGFGTMDELFELLTLVQTRKTKKYMPIIVFGSEYWKELVNFDAMLKWGMITKEDLDLFHFYDDVDEAFSFLKQFLTKQHKITC